MLHGAIYTTILFLLMLIGIGVLYVSFRVDKMYKILKNGLKINIMHDIADIEYEGNDRY